MRSPATFTVHTDPQHGWVAVKRDFLKALGILDDITPYSYQRGATVYLEEDCDAGTFVKAYEAKFGKAPTWKNGKWSNSSSPVRSYDCFSASRDPRDEAAAYKALAVGDVVTIVPGYSIKTVTIVGFNSKGAPLGLAPDYDSPYTIKLKHFGGVVKA